MNYDLEMQKQMENIKEGEKLLLHACCAPCSSAVLERIANFFEVSIFYYNPNITEETEYKKRIEETKKLISLIHPKYPVHLVEGRYDPKEFFEMAKGLEEEPERGRRCYKCYHLRLEETAKIAQELGFNYFCINQLTYILTLKREKAIKEVLNYRKLMIYIGKIIVDVFIPKEIEKRNDQNCKEWSLFFTSKKGSFIIK